MNSGNSIILKKNQLKMSLNFLSQISWQVHGKDYPTYVVMTLNNKAPRLISEIANYTSRDYDLRAVYQYLTFDTDCFSIPQLSSIAIGENKNGKLKTKLDNVSGIERGKKLIDELEKKFGEEKITKIRLFSDFIKGRKAMIISGKSKKVDN